VAPARHLLALDTATDIASIGIVDATRGEALAELETSPASLLASIDGLLSASKLEKSDLQGVVVGVGPGRYTSLRIGLASARAVARTLAIPIAGVSTLDGLAAGAPEAVPLIDARRGEVFTRAGELVCVRPEQVSVEGRLCVGDGAIAYREELEARGASIPGDTDTRHRVRPACLVASAESREDSLPIEPIYLRVPDAERTRKEFPQA
jgi:tRNA threonylcarbamoyladenosine biosynthesis protein TsaB